MIKSRKAARGTLYSIGTTPSLRRAGIRGPNAFVEIPAGDIPAVAVTGTGGGRIEIPLSDIRWLRAGVEYGRITHYRCVIARERGADIVVDGGLGDYRAMVLHLAEEMRGLGLGGRVQRGLRWWENMIHLVIFGGISLTLCYVPFDTYRHYGADWECGDLLLAAVLSLVGLSFLLGVIGLWLRCYRPRGVRGADDLAKALP